MFQSKPERRSDHLCKVEELEPRRFLSVSAEGEAPVEEPAPEVTDASSETYETTSDEVTFGDGGEMEILTMGGGDMGVTEDGNIICYMTGEVVSVSSQHP